MCEQVAQASEAQAAEVLNRTDLGAKERTAQALDLLMGVHIDSLRGSPHGKELIAVAEDGKIGDTFGPKLKSAVTQFLPDFKAPAWTDK